MSNTFDFDINFNLLANEVKKMNIESMIINASNNRATDKTNIAAVDCNDKYFSYKPHIGIPAGDAKLNPDSDSMTDPLPSAGADKMELAQEVNTQDPGGVECELAVVAEMVGYAKMVIPVTREIVVQPVAGSKMLDLGTPIFVEQTAKGQEGYRHIGSVWDIFGTVNEPMYSVIMMKEIMLCDSFIVGSKVFFMCGHPETRYLSIECDGDSYVIKHSQSL